MVEIIVEWGDWFFWNLHHKFFGEKKNGLQLISSCPELYFR